VHKWLYPANSYPFYLPYFNPTDFGSYLRRLLFFEFRNSLNGYAQTKVPRREAVALEIPKISTASNSDIPEKTQLDQFGVLRIFPMELVQNKPRIPSWHPQAIFCKLVGRLNRAQALHETPAG
jgi:hypothetical protein